MRDVAVYGFANVEQADGSGRWSLVRRSASASDSVALDFSGQMLRMDAGAFEGCPFKNAALDGHDVLAVFLSGSQMMGCQDSRSDYDLDVFVADCDTEEPQCRMIYGGRGLHWYYVSRAKFGSRDAIRHALPQETASLVSLDCLRPEHLLHTGDGLRAKRFAARMLEEAPGISRDMCELYCLWMRMNGLFGRMLTGDYDFGRMSKTSWCRYYAPARLIGAPIDWVVVRHMHDARRDGRFDEEDIGILRSVIVAYMEKNQSSEDDVIARADALEGRVAAKWRALFDAE